MDFCSLDRIYSRTAAIAAALTKASISAPVYRSVKSTNLAISTSAPTGYFLR